MRISWDNFIYLQETKFATVLQKFIRCWLHRDRFLTEKRSAIVFQKGDTISLFSFSSSPLQCIVEKWEEEFLRRKNSTLLLSFSKNTREE